MAREVELLERLAEQQEQAEAALRQQLGAAAEAAAASLEAERGLHCTSMYLLTMYLPCTCRALSDVLILYLLTLHLLCSCRALATH